MTSKELSVRLNSQPIGILTQTKGGSLQFRYLENARQSLSLSMPLSDKTYSNAVCEAFFGGLLPESHSVRQTIARKYGISANNTFSLLEVIGHDCAGAVSLVDPDEPVSKDEWHEITAKSITDKELAQHVRELPSRPLFVGLEGIRLSLAGAQDKAAVVIRDNNICLPKNDCPTTHILKPEIPRFAGSVQNEYLCMRLAKAIGLPVADVEMRKIDNVTVLLIARYDRELSDNRIRRIHQEDFCQALAIPSANKYQKEGGPNFQQSFELMLKTTMPAANRNTLAEALIFNLLIGNADAHGKNFSLLHVDPNTVMLAPFYDFLSTTSYPELSQEMAMKIGDSYFAKSITLKDWEALCKAIGYAFPILRQIIKRQTEILPELAAKEHEALCVTSNSHKATNNILKIISQNCQTVQKQLNLN